MPSNLSVSVSGLGKMYRIYDRPQDRLRQMLFARFGRSYGRAFWGLRSVSFQLQKGETIGIIGRNGSGKSTLLQIIAGTLAPTEGEVSVSGRVAALLELGSGFNPDFTGRENVFLNGSILGVRRGDMVHRFDEIAAFADIGDFIDQPVKTYSSGMMVRLAFAVQACLEPEVLLIDEALSVGDIFFAQKCFARIDELKTRRTSIVLVSHSMGAIEKLCDRVLLLDKGECVFLGHPNEAVQRFYRLEKTLSTSTDCDELDMEKGVETPIQKSDYESIPDWPSAGTFVDISPAKSLGNDLAVCTAVALCDSQGCLRHTFEMGQEALFYFEFELLRDIAIPVGGIVITNAMNVVVHGKNSLQNLAKAPSAVRKGGRVRFRQSVRLAIAPGQYTFDVGLATIDPTDHLNYLDMSYSQVVDRISLVAQLHKAGQFHMTMCSHGQSLPFHGLVDLGGESTIALV